MIFKILGVNLQNIMNSQQKQEFLEFLEPLDDKATIYDLTHRFLCFRYNNDRTQKDWIKTHHPKDSAAFTSDLVFPKVSLSIPYLTKIKDVKEIINNVKIKEEV